MVLYTQDIDSFIIVKLMLATFAKNQTNDVVTKFISFLSNCEDPIPYLLQLIWKLEEARPMSSPRSKYAALS